MDSSTALSKSAGVGANAGLSATATAATTGMPLSAPLAARPSDQSHGQNHTPGFGHYRVRELQLQLQLDSPPTGAPSPLLSTISPRHPHPDHAFPLASPTPLSPLGHLHAHSQSQSHPHSLSHTLRQSVASTASIIPSVPPSPDLKFGSLATTHSSVLADTDADAVTMPNACSSSFTGDAFFHVQESALVAAAATAAATLERLDSTLREASSSQTQSRLGDQQQNTPSIPPAVPVINTSNASTKSSAPPLARSSSTPLVLKVAGSGTTNSINSDTGTPLPMSPRALSTPSSPTPPTLPVLVPTTTIHHPPTRSASHRRDQLEHHFHHTFPLSASAPVSPSSSPAPDPAPLVSPTTTAALTDYSLPPVSAIPPESEVQRAADAARASSFPSWHANTHTPRKPSFAATQLGTPFAQADELSTIGSASLTPSTLSHAYTSPPATSTPAGASHSAASKTESSALPKWRDLVAHVAAHRARGNQLFQAGEYEQAAAAYGAAAREFELVAFQDYHPESGTADGGGGGGGDASLKTVASSSSLKTGGAAARSTPGLSKRASIMNFGSLFTSWLPSSGGSARSGAPGGSLPRNMAGGIRKQQGNLASMGRSATADSGIPPSHQDWSHAFTPPSETTVAGVSALTSTKPAAASTVTRLLSDWLPSTSSPSSSSSSPPPPAAHPSLDALLVPPTPSALPPTLHQVPSLPPFPPLPLSTLPRSVRRDAAHVYANRSAAFTKLALRLPISPTNPLARRALMDADRAVQLDPEWAKAHFRRADALLLLDRPAAAKSALAHVTLLDPQASKSSGLQARRERAAWAVDDGRSGLRILQLAAGRDYCTPGAVPKWSLIRHLLHVYARQMRNCMYIVADEAAGTCVVVDPAWDPDALVVEIQQRGWTLAGVVVGHAHVDHVGGRPPPPFDRWRVQVPGLRALVKAAHKAKIAAHGLPVPVYMHPAEAGILAAADAGFANDPKLDGVRRMCPTPDGFTVRVGRAVVLEFWHTPGHTPGSQMVLVNGNRVLSSDTVFAGAVGRCDLPGGDARVMKRTLMRLRARLPEKAVIFPGHAYGPMATTVEREKREGGALDPLVWEVLLSEMGLAGCDGHHGHGDQEEADQGQRVVTAAVGAGMRRSSLDA